MKAYYSLFIISLFVLNSFTVFSQNDSINYKLSRITLSSGELIKRRNITLYDNNVSFYEYNSTTGQTELVSYSLSDIQNIKVATKNSFLPGLLIGTGVGVITMLIVEKVIEKPKTETKITPTGWESRTLTRTMVTGEKIGIVAGGALIGTLIGVLIKRGWETVFPQSTSMFDKIDFNLILNHKYGNTARLTLSYKF